MAGRTQGRNASSVGMMEGAFFVGRTELLDWVNGLLSVNLSKVEQCASGAIFCQVVDACHPGTVKMGKLNWMARADHEYIPNYKILQSAFDRNHIDKHVAVDQLIRAKYQDNLEMLQWMKAMWDREGSGISDYEPVSARAGRPVPVWAKPKEGLVRAERPVDKENMSGNREAVATDKKFAPVRRAAPATAAAKAGAQRTTTPRSAARPGAAPANTVRRDDESQLKLADQAEEINELRGTLEGLENERDYYFSKLRNVEILCTTLQAKMDASMDAPGVIKEILGILYAENDEEGDEAEPAEPNTAETMEEVPELPTFSTELQQQCIEAA